MGIGARRRRASGISAGRVRRWPLARGVLLALALVASSAASAHADTATITPSSGYRGTAISFSASGPTPLVDGCEQTYSWSFAGGSPSTSTDANPTVTFGTLGDHAVSVTIGQTSLTPGGGMECGASDTGGTTVTVVEGVPTAPDIQLPANPLVGAKLAFKTNGATDPDGDPVTLSWDFGDGNTAGDTKTTSHIYDAAGSYRITLTASDGHPGGTTQSFATLVVRRPPTTPTLAAPSTVAVFGSVTLHAEGSTDSEGGQPTYTWDLNHDGTYGDAVGDTVSTSFSTPGNLTVSVKAVDGHGLVSGAANAPILVQNGAPAANLEATPTTVKTGVPIQLSAVGTDPEGRALTYAWDLNGDGQFTDLVQNGQPSGQASMITKSFPAAGTYTVAVKVTDEFTAYATDKVTIVVSDQSPAVPSFTFSPGGPLTGQSVTFTSTSTPGGAPIGTQTWDLDDDGLYDDASGPSAQWTFTTPGTHIVRLKVADANFPANVAPTTFQRVVVVDPAPATPTTTTTPAAPAPPAPPAVTATAATKPSMLSPFPIVRIRGRTAGSGVRISLLSVQAPAGSQVRVVCTGKGCPKARTVAKSVKNGARSIVFKTMQRRLAQGATVEVFVTKPGFVGKYTRFRVRKGKAPARKDACAVTSSRKPVTCPSG